MQSFKLSGHAILRSFTHIILTALVLSGFSISSVNAVVLSFDDVPGGSIQNSLGDMPTYKGFDFSNTLDWIDVEGPTWDFGAHSGDFALLNNLAGVGTVIDAGGADFTFEGLWAKQWATGKNSGGANSLFGTLSGYNNGAQLWSISTGLNGSYQFFNAQLGLIDELRLGFGDTFLVDDLELVVSLNPIPVPAAVWLFGTALIGLVGFAKRKSRIAA